MPTAQSATTSCVLQCLAMAEDCSQPNVIHLGSLLRDAVHHLARLLASESPSITLHNGGAIHIRCFYDLGVQVDRGALQRALSRAASGDSCTVCSVLILPVNQVVHRSARLAVQLYFAASCAAHLDGSDDD